MNSNVPIPIQPSIPTTTANVPRSTDNVLTIGRDGKIKLSDLKYVQVAASASGQVIRPSVINVNKVSDLNPVVREQAPFISMGGKQLFVSKSQGVQYLHLVPISRAPNIATINCASSSHPEPLNVIQSTSTNQTTNASHVILPATGPTVDVATGQGVYQKPIGFSDCNAGMQHIVYKAKRPCNCTKSNCLKLYCDCFANGEFCRNCNCVGCRNNLIYEHDRGTAIKQALEKNPQCFHPKIGKGRDETDRQHKKGCHCKKSGCLKNYCECYEAKITCTSKCKCVGCQNTDMKRHRPRPPTSSTLSLLASSESIGFENENEQVASQFPTLGNTSLQSDKRLPTWCLTDDVIEATAMCLITAAGTSESSAPILDAENVEKAILEEFGRCMLQIVQNATA